MRIVTLFLCILSRIKSFIVEKQILEFDRAFFTRFWLCVFRVCANKPVNDRVVVRVDFMKICINRHFTMTKKQSSSQAWVRKRLCFQSVKGSCCLELAITVVLKDFRRGNYRRDIIVGQVFSLRIFKKVGGQWYQPVYV